MNSSLLLRLICIVSILIASNSCILKQGPSSTPDGFEIHPDFDLELVAAEPLVFDPVDMEFDAEARAFVLEMPGYPLRDEESRLILLTDEDGDGRYDNREVYADKLGLASSFMPYKGGMLVASPPQLLFLTDTDGDNKADQRDILMEGFSAGNLQHNFNGLTYGLDNWIYAANGGNSGEPYFVDDPSSALPLRGEDFRFNLEKKMLERVGESSGGFELAFDNWGRMYETHNLEHVSHLVMEGRYTDGLPLSPSHALSNISDHEENGLSRIYPIGAQDTRVNHPEQSGYFSGSCGITFYGGGAFPEGFNDHLFVCDVVLNLVHLDMLSSDGTSFKTSRSQEKAEFLASTDRAFRPVNMTSGPDGTLYLMDMHRDVIEHPEWIPDEIEATQDLSAGKEQGRIYRITSKGQVRDICPIDKSNASSLLDGLGHSNQWTRMTAQRLLVKQNDSQVIPSLESLVQEKGNPYAQLHAMWTLEGMGELSDELLQQILSEEKGGLLENAIKITEKRLNQSPSFVEDILKAINQSDIKPRARMQAILALSTLDESNYRSSASEMQNALFPLLSDSTHDSWTVMAVTIALSRNPMTTSKALLASGKVSWTPAESELMTTMCRLVGQEQDVNQSTSLLRELANVESETVRIMILDALADGWESGEKNVRLGNLGKKPYAVLNPIEANGSVAIVRAAGRLRKAMTVPSSPTIRALLVQAQSAVFDSTLSPQKRLEWLELLTLDSFDKSQESFYRLIDNRQPLVLQEAVLRQLWESNHPDVDIKLIAMWPSLGPEARKGAANILLYKEDHHEHLLTALEDGQINLGELNLDLERRRVLLFSQDKEIKTRAEALFSDAGVVKRKEAIEQMRPALALAGDAEEGKTLFSTQCATCHQYGDLGQEVGPVLTEIHRKSKEALLYEILDPNAAVDTRYLNHQVRMKDGTILSGMIFQETDTELGLRMIGGLEQRVNKTDIADLSSLGISLMPEGFEGAMSVEEMADLLAFLTEG